jgi:hypothetical protein
VCFQSVWSFGPLPRATDRSGVPKGAHRLTHRVPSSSSLPIALMTWSPYDQAHATGTAVSRCQARCVPMARPPPWPGALSAFNRPAQCGPFLFASIQIEKSRGGPRQQSSEQKSLAASRDPQSSLEDPGLVAESTRRASSAPGIRLLFLVFSKTKAVSLALLRNLAAAQWKDL